MRKQTVNPSPPPCCMIEMRGFDPVGYAFGRNDDWCMKLDLNAGRYGQPSLGLNFQFDAHAKVNKRTVTVRAEPRSFQVDWYPGITMNAKPMMKNFKAGPIVDASDKVKQYIPEKWRTTADSRMMYIAFDSTGYSLTNGSHYQTGWSHLEQKDRKFLSSLFLPKVNIPTKRLTIWFMPPNKDTFIEKCLPFFTQAFTLRTPGKDAYVDDWGRSLFIYNSQKCCLEFNRNRHKITRDPEILPSTSPSFENIEMGEDDVMKEENTEMEEDVRRTYHSGSEKGELKEEPDIDTTQTQSQGKHQGESL